MISGMKKSEMMQWYIEVHLQSLQSKSLSESNFEQIRAEYQRINTGIYKMLKEADELGFKSDEALFETLEADIKSDVERYKSAIINMLNENSTPQYTLIDMYDKCVSIQRDWYTFRTKVKDVVS